MLASMIRVLSILAVFVALFFVSAPAFADACNSIARAEAAKRPNMTLFNVRSVINNNGQLVCVSISTDEIQVRLLSTDMQPGDNRLVFSIDTDTYVVRKTFFGR